MRDIWLWWSSGKDSAWTLWELQRSREYRVTRLVTTLNGAADRVAMHGVRDVLLTRQSEAAGVPVERVPLPHPCTNEQYEAAVKPVVERAVDAGVAAMAFGDLFLEDVRAYRLALLDQSPVEPVFPIWGRETGALARGMIDAGMRAFVTCVDPAAIPRELAGAAFDADFLRELPAAADPCGENGEFHTFVADGPMFAEPIPVEPGEVVEREGFVFADLRLADVA